MATDARGARGLDDADVFGGDSVGAAVAVVVVVVVGDVVVGADAAAAEAAAEAAAAAAAEEEAEGEGVAVVMMVVGGAGGLLNGPRHGMANVAHQSSGESHFYAMKTKIKKKMKN